MQGKDGYISQTIKLINNDYRDIFYIPRIVENSNEYQTKLKLLLNKYLIFCRNNLSELDIDFEKVSNISASINEVLRLYFEGNIRQAYENIFELFGKNIAYLFVEDFDNIYDNSERKPFSVYRARYTNEKIYNIEKMFHIPFNQRYKVDEQRFSIKGIPCLYLGSTPYVCRKEILKPTREDDECKKYNQKDKKCYISRFQYKKRSSFRILNLATHLLDIFRVKADIDNINSHDLIAYGKMSQEEYLKKALYTFPIQCACHFLVQNENDRGFRIEYTIPQMIMNSIKNFQVDGFSYCSTIFHEENPYSVYLMTNFAFPAYRKSNELYSEKLSKIFEVTEPLCFEDFIENKQSKPSQPLFEGIIKFADFMNNNKNIGSINGHQYTESVYKQLEKELEKKKVYDISIRNI